MISIDEAYVDASAPNADAIKNGRGLVVKGKFLKLHTDDGEALLFGECQGSGQEPYRCSCDFARADQPTHRCTCPSRQFPCKHCLGLMYAFVQKRPSFQVADVPADLAEKREKLSERTEKKKEDAAKPKTVDKAALAKKIRAQLERDRPPGEVDARPGAHRHREHERQNREGNRGEGQATRQRLPAWRAGDVASVHEVVRQ
ncbi:MAG: SWIM zinc finger family protein [Planctomycetaceae bacterium]|nr:SWIM zinc finger family protein [Planctomycetaceae bacterium]